MTQTLIISDETAEISEIQRILSDQPIEYFICSNLVEGLEILHKEELDLVLCSEKINNKNSLFNYGDLKEFFRKISIPFLLILPRNVEKSHIQVYLELGFDNLIFSPIKERNLKAKVNSALEKHGKSNLLKSVDFFEFLSHSNGLFAIISKEKVIKSTKSFEKFLKEELRISLKEFSISILIENISTGDLDTGLLRFLNGLESHHVLRGLKVKNKRKVDIRFFKGENFDFNSYLIEIVFQQQWGLHNMIEFSSPNLSPREKQVLELSQIGLSLKVIAQKLGLSSRTVERHRASIMQKTNSSNIIEAISKLHILCG